MVNGYERAANEVVPAARIVIAKQLKSRYNMTESSIAGVLGVAQAAVSKYLNGKCSPTVAAVCKEVGTQHLDPHIEAIAKGDKAELKHCICSICGATNKFDCKFSYVKDASQA